MSEMEQPGVVATHPEAASTGLGQGCYEGLFWFASVLEALDHSNANAHKLEVLRRCLSDGLSERRHDDLAWLIYFLAGGKLPRSVRSAVLREAAMQASGLSAWLFEACYAHAGDLAETIAYCLDHSQAFVTPSLTLSQRHSDAPRLDQTGSTEPAEPANSPKTPKTLDDWLVNEAMPVTGQAAPAQIAWLIAQWRVHPAKVRFAMNKIMTGGFRLGVSRAMVLRALAEASGLSGALIAQRFMAWTRQLPSAERLSALLAESSTAALTEQVLPFCLAHGFDQDWEAMGDPRAWQLEWKWDGIRVQWIAGKKQSYLWSRGEELISEQFPDLKIETVRHLVPAGSIIDAELLAWDQARDQLAGFAALQTRLNRKRLSASLMRSHPVVLVAYDLLRLGDEDLRSYPLSLRREKLQALAEGLSGALMLSPCFSIAAWPELADLRLQASKLRAEGLMLKHRHSAYGAGRSKIYQDNGLRGGWWKWKQDPFTVDAVLIYAQAGHGRRANLYTDYTFAVQGPEGWLTFAKAYSGLSDAEIREVDARIRKTTLEQFGPVRVVEPTMVFELGFESIAASKRHKAGFALRFPRMLRWRKDKRIEDADRIERLHELLRISGS
jgi:DNA ligase-1